jgi:hypothetical protein
MSDEIDDKRRCFLKTVGAGVITVSVASEGTHATSKAFTPTPEDDATGVAVDATVKLEFSRDIQRGDGSFYFRKYNDKSVIIEEVSVSEINIGPNNKTAIINEQGEKIFDKDTKIYLHVPDGVLEDADGDDWFGIDRSNNEKYEFETGKVNCNQESYQQIGSASACTTQTTKETTTQVQNTPGNTIECEKIRGSITTGIGQMAVYRDPEGTESRELVRLTTLSGNTEFGNSAFTDINHRNGTAPEKWTMTMHWQQTTGSCTNVTKTIGAANICGSGSAPTTSGKVSNGSNNSIQCEKVRASVTTGTGTMVIYRHTSDGGRKPITSTELTPQSTVTNVSPVAGSTPEGWTAVMDWESV